MHNPTTPRILHHSISRFRRSMRPERPNVQHARLRNHFYFSFFLIVVLAFLYSANTRLALLTRQIFVAPFSHHRFPTMSSSAYSNELNIALLAVQRATLLTQRVFHDNAKGTLSKDDASPVTIGDFGAQALIISALRHNFPHDEIVGEEEANLLRENVSLAEKILTLVREAKLADAESEKALGGAVKDMDAMLTAIDAGNSPGGPKGRIWALDPIDGTKGFLRGGQYAVCLALIVDGDVKVGVLGCPNLPISDTAPISADVGTTNEEEGRRGVLFSATKGSGATSRPLLPGALASNPTSIHMKPLSSLASATFCESVEAAHSSHSDQSVIATRLGISKESVRMDSQAKYASIARGAGDIYLRLPVRGKGYVEKIWDHAAGEIIVREAGGEVSDARGERLDFGRGRRLEGNRGVVAAGREVHGRVVEVVREVLGEERES
ncbi:MAG: hypothetical protein LQ350_004498 [Teloschistes chrysophthalmus]|nr:MAG: hypothetical protein LQ350_004498 [Niorma chrysophthalma]